MKAGTPAAATGEPVIRHATWRVLLLAGTIGLAGASLRAHATDAPAAAQDRTAPTAAGKPVPQPSRSASALDRRVELLGRELNLDATQRLKVRALLESQREQVLRLWNDESVPSAVRVQRTRAIGTGTEDAIRALLTDTQRQKYAKARPAGNDAASAGSPDLPTWIDSVNGH